MVKVSFNVDEPFWAKEMPLFKKSILKAKPVLISPLEMHSVAKNNNKKSVIAINEVSLLRQSRQTASLQIMNGKKILIKNIVLKIW